MRESDHKASVDPSKCIACGVCTYACPFGAIMDKSWIVQAVHMLKGAQQWKYRVYAVVAPAIAGQFAEASLGQVVTGMKKLGFYDVREVAEGADLTAHAEAQELAEGGASILPAVPPLSPMWRPSIPNRRIRSLAPPLPWS